MVLCDFWPLPDVIPGDGELVQFLNVWLWSAFFGTGIVLGLGGIVFHLYYVNPSFETWRWKTNPAFPSPEMIKVEVLKSTKGAVIGTFFPALALFLAQTNSPYTKGYCGMTEERGVMYHVVQFAVMFVVTDFYEFFYHHLGHTIERCWDQHKSHHQFYNPSPFAVIADDFVDQVFRAGPMFVYPMLMPVNIDLMFAQWGTLFYIYGTYLHWGFESKYISAHNKVLNTAYDHHLHHRLSIKNKAIRTGFFLKIWDDMFGSIYKSDCLCVRCQHEQGKRTLDEFKKVHIPDYSILLSPSFWLQSKGEHKLK